MNKKTAKLFQNGRSQAVRLPKEFRFQGKEVRISRVSGGVLLQPQTARPDVEAWFAELDRLRPEKFMVGGRKQPKPQRRKKTFK